LSLQLWIKVFATAHYALWDKVCRQDVLLEAYRCRANAGAAGGQAAGADASAGGRRSLMSAQIARASHHRVHRTKHHATAQVSDLWANPDTAAMRVDSGATDVMLPRTVAAWLISAGSLTPADYVTTKTSKRMCRPSVSAVGRLFE
jgi:hypothetical protein